MKYIEDDYWSNELNVITWLNKNFLKCYFLNVYALVHLNK